MGPRAEFERAEQALAEHLAHYPRAGAPLVFYSLLVAYARNCQDLLLRACLDEERGKL